MIFPPIIPIAPILLEAQRKKRTAAQIQTEINEQQQARLRAIEAGHTLPLRINWHAGLAVVDHRPRVASCELQPDPAQSWDEFCERTAGMTTDELLAGVSRLRSARQ